MGTADRGHFSVDTDRVEVPGARVVFGAAFALMVLNFADRHVVVAAFPQLEAEWGASDKGKRAKFYSLTAAGRRQLGREKQDWTRLSTAIALVLEKA